MIDSNEAGPARAGARGGRADVRESVGFARQCEDAAVPLGERWNVDVDRLLYEQAALIEDRDRLAKENERLTAERDQLAAERHRLLGELRALRGAKGHVPHTSGDLQKWRLDRGFTQREAAKHLGVGHTTLEEAELRPPETLLGRKLRLALERDAEEMRAGVRRDG